MTDEELQALSYEEKEQRLDEILERLDQSETPMDQLASDARKATQLIKAMRTTLRSAQTEIAEVLEELDEEEEGSD